MGWEIVPNEGNTREVRIKRQHVGGYAIFGRLVFGYTCRCGATYDDRDACPQCGYPATMVKRVILDHEKALAEAAGIDYTDEANWDTIERLARVAQDIYE